MPMFAGSMKWELTKLQDSSCDKAYFNKTKTIKKESNVKERKKKKRRATEEKHRNYANEKRLNFLKNNNTFCK